jgi:hypothetical protein
VDLVKHHGFVAQFTTTAIDDELAKPHAAPIVFDPIGTFMEFVGLPFGGGREQRKWRRRLWFWHPFPERTDMPYLRLKIYSTINKMEIVVKARS